MSLFGGTNVPGAAAAPDVEVPNFYQARGSNLLPLKGPRPVVPSPQDQGIAPQDGDDTSAPNAVLAKRLNRAVCVAQANVGYSKAAKDTLILPCALEYEAIVSEGAKAGDFALTLKMIAEFESSFPEEGMVVWLKKHQQVINDERLSELLLVETAFEDYAGGRWVPITTDIRYAEEAEAVVQAVITSDSGQTAGRVTTDGSVEDAKLGPVGERGRIVFTYRCEKLYSYAEMGMGDAVGSRHLVPLALQLPWAALDNPGNACRVRASVRAPLGSVQLDPHANILAHLDLQRSLHTDHDSPIQAVLLPEGAVSNQQQGPEWAFASEALPPRPLAVLTWLSIPSEDDGWEQVESLQLKGTHATIQQATPNEEALLRVALPGGQEGHLVRCKVNTEAPKRRPGSMRVHTDITISDASGSTGMHARGQRQSVRALFNQHEERRMLKRLEAIPKLRDAGVLLDNDIWRTHVVIFDHGVRMQFGVESQVSDLDHATVSSLVRALTNADPTAGSALQLAGKGGLLSSWSDMLSKLRGTTPGGMTSFTVGAAEATKQYASAVRSKYQGRADVECTSYVNFDTDGGHNRGGSCDQQIAELVEQADVVQGHVLGIGAWVDQDCATRVAKILKGSASLSLEFPAEVSADALFRQDLSHWIKVLRSAPVTLRVSAGSTAWQARHGVRNENGCDCLFAAGEGARFDAPDVSEMDYTKAVVKGVQAGEAVTLYLLSRWRPDELASRLTLDVAGVMAKVTVGTEPLQGITLGYHWLSLLGGGGSKGVSANNASLCGRLRHRLEDDLSFAWNLPTKSGSTAATGRARTQHRLPVSKEQQPAEPPVPKLRKPARQHGIGGGGGNSWGGGGGLFGGPPASCVGFGAPGGMPAAAMRSAPAPKSRARACLGSAPQSASACFGSAAPQRRSAARGGGFGAAEAAPAAPTSGLMLCSASSPMASMACGFGGFGGGPPSMPQALGGPPPPPGWGGQQAPSWGQQAEQPSTQQGPKTPTELLQGSDYMHFGQDEKPEDAAVRGVKALKHLASMACQAPHTLPGGPAPEDPLVGDLLGLPGSGGLLPGRGAPAAAGTMHNGFVCDASQVNPIMGVRYKATSAFDVDITDACRQMGKFAGGAGFKAIATPETAMRFALAAALRWWPFIWPGRGDVFNGPMPDLGTLQVAHLGAAVMNLPDAPAPRLSDLLS